MTAEQDRAAKARRMEEVIRGYFDACNTGDADAVAKFFAPGAVHYFPPDMYKGDFRGGDADDREVVVGGADAGLALDRRRDHLRPGFRTGGDRVDQREDQDRRGAAWRRVVPLPTRTAG